MKNTRKGTARKAAPRPPKIDYANAAEIVLDLLASPHVTQLIKDAIHDTLVEAQNQTQIEIMIPGGYDPAQLAVLLKSADAEGLRIHSGYFSTNASRARTDTETLRPLSKDELGAHLSAILNSPTTPATLYNAIADELCAMSSDIDYHTPEMIERTLAAYERKEAKRQKGGAK